MRKIREAEKLRGTLRTCSCPCGCDVFVNSTDGKICPVCKINMHKPGWKPAAKKTPRNKPKATAPRHKGKSIKRGTSHRKWTEDETSELARVCIKNLELRRLKGWSDKPRGRLAEFAAKHNRTLAAVKMRAKRLRDMGFQEFKSYFKT